MTLCDLTEEELRLLGIVGTVGVHVKRLLLAILLHVVLWMRNGEYNLRGVLGKGTELHFLHDTRLVLTCKQPLVIEDKQLGDVLDIGSNGKTKFVCHLVVQHACTSNQVGMQLFGDSLYLR